MMWAILLIVLCLLFVVALFWKPKPRNASPSQSQPFMLPSFDGKSERDRVLDEDLQIIAEAIRSDEADRRRSAALDRIKSYSKAK